MTQLVAFSRVEEIVPLIKGESVVDEKASNSSGFSTPLSETKAKVDTVIVVQKLKKPKKEKEIAYPFWCCLGDDDEEGEGESSKKIEKKYERMGWRQVAFLSGAYGATTISSVFFFRAPAQGSSTTPTIIQEFAGASMDLAKKGMLFVPKEYKGAVRCATYAALPTLFVASQYLTLPSEIANEMLRAIPWIYPSMGVLRVDFNEYINLRVPAKYFNISKKYNKGIDALDAGWKITAAAATQALSSYGTIKAASAVIFKGESRRWIDLAEEQILPLEGTRRKVALAALFGTLGIMAAAGVANMTWGSERYLDVILLTPPIDTLIRTPKARLKDWIKGKNEEKVKSDGSLLYYAKEGGKIAGMAILLSALGAIAAQAAKGNAGFATALLIDLASIIKVLSKRISPYAMITLAGLYMAVAGAIYVADEFSGQEVNGELYQTMMGIAALMFATAMYQVRKQVVPPKKPKEGKVKKVKETKSPKIEEVQEAEMSGLEKVNSLKPSKIEEA